MANRNSDIEEDLLAAQEELHTAEEELRAQNEQLIAAHEDLLAERQRYQELFNFAPHGYLVTNRHGVIREANLAASELLNRPRRYLTDKPVRVFVISDDRPRLDALLARVHGPAAVAGEELRLERDSRAPIAVAVQVNTTPHAESKEATLRWLLHDLTERKAAEARAARADRLAAVGQTVTAIGHESRSVLQRIQACLRLVRLEAADRPRVLDLLDRSGQAVEDLNRLFEDIRAGVVAPHLKMGNCALRPIWRNAWEQAARRGPSATFDDSAADDFACVADALRMHQVFANLFENSLDAGASRVTVRADDDTLADRPAVRIAVRDNGPGLTPEQRRRMFEPFFTTRHAGTGLGLAVVRGIIEAHGGMAAVADDVHDGAEIVLTIPRAPS